MVIEAGRRGDFASDVPGAGRQFGVEPAALSLPGFVTQPGRLEPCSQQLPVAVAGTFAGAAAFPTAAGAVVDNSGLGCPN